MPPARVAVVLLALTAVAPLPGPHRVPAPPSRTLAVTIDDVPGVPLGGGCDPEPLLALNRRLVDTLIAYGVPATGFVVEGRVCDAVRDTVLPVALATWLDAGLGLGNHTFSHPDLNATTVEAFTADVLRGERTTRPLLAARALPLRYFRYPQLHTGDTPAKRRAVATFLAERGYANAPVTIDSQEWVFAAAYGRALAHGDSATARCVARAYVPFMEAVTAFFERRAREVVGYEPPQVLLLHANALNADRLPALLAMYRERGYHLIPLAQALADPAYALDDGYVGRLGLSWIHRWAAAQDRAPATEPREPAWVRDAAAGEPPVRCPAP